MSKINILGFLTLVIASLTILMSTTFSSVAEGDFSSNSPSSLIYNVPSGDLFFENNIDLEVSLDNLSLLMTLTLLFDEMKREGIDSEHKITIEKIPEINESTPSLFLENGKDVSLETLIQGVAVFSAKDATEAIANWIESDRDSFIDLMNKKALELGMTSTKYTNVYGSKNDVSTASDLLLLTSYLLSEYKEEMYYFSEDEFNYNKKTFVNQNSFLKDSAGSYGLKSGWGSKFHLITLTKIKGSDFIVINLNEDSSKTRNRNATLLVEWAEDNYKDLVIGKKGGVYDEFYVYRSDTNGPDDVHFSDDLSVLVSGGIDRSDLKHTFVGKPYITGKTKKGDVLGTLEVSLNDRMLGSVDIIATKDYPKAKLIPSFFDSIAILFNYTLMDWISSFLGK